jgi:hypothetical protein
MTGADWIAAALTALLAFFAGVVAGWCARGLRDLGPEDPQEKLPRLSWPPTLPESDRADRVPRVKPLIR